MKNNYVSNDSYNQIISYVYKTNGKVRRHEKYNK